MEWFTKSFLPPISRDAAIIGATTEEQGILHAQHLDLIYSHLHTLYNIIPNVSRLSNNTRNPNPGPLANDVVGYVSHASMNQLVDQMGKIPLSHTHQLSVLMLRIMYSLLIPLR
jgi:hypothetical protein